MKNGFIVMIYAFLLLGTNSETNSHNYDSYSAVSTNTNLSGQTVESSTADQSAVYITNSGITIENSIIKKTSGDSSNTENSEFYGVNAAILVQGGGVTITDGEISTAAKGANAICATNSGTVTITGTTITSTGSSSARGLHATYGGTITATDVTISSTGGSCATLATDRGEGTVTCTECTLSTAGSGSPLIYSTGSITVSKTSGTASGAQMVVVEGKNTAIVQDSSSLKCTGVGNRNNVDNCGIFLYQSMSGDADEGTSSFKCTSSTLEIESSSSVYSSAPMFFITNTDSDINLNDCTFTYGSGTFLSATGTSEWGESGSNGGTVTLTLTNQEIEGDFIVDNISSLAITMVNSSIKGKINTDNQSSNVQVTLDADSKITLTGNSYISSLSNADATGSNIDQGSYTLTVSGSSSSTSNPTSNETSNPTSNPPSKPTSTVSTNEDTENPSDNSTDPIIRINSAPNNLSSFGFIYSILMFLTVF